ncbi:hypothetical protein LINGRAHAP2_LOCUS17618 [Linum grandiflorum]
MAEEKSQATVPSINDAAEVKDAPGNVEANIRTAMTSRVSYFKEQADSLTCEGVRRVLEEDLGLEKFALDVHKRFVKELLLESLQGAVDSNAQKDSTITGSVASCSIKDEASEAPEGDESKPGPKDVNSEEDEKMEDSPVMGLLTGQKKSKTDANNTKDNEKKGPTENVIKKAIWKRASYIGANSETITMAGLRRLLEEDLKLDKGALDSFKKFISTQLDEVLESTEIHASKKKTSTTKSQSKPAKKVSSKVKSDSSDNDDGEEEDVDEVKPKKKASSLKKTVISEGSKKRGRSEKEFKVSAKKRSKPVKSPSHDSSKSEDEENASEDGDSQSSQEKPVKKREASTPVPTYGKRVEHLKSTIKACGMSVPPTVYKKVKQVPENKREAALIKELEAILSKENLSSNPSEKEIKEVRRKKERAKELEGIDMSNIVSSSRRRSTSSYVPPPKPKVPIESDSESEEEDDDEEEDDEDDDDNNEEDDVVDEESQSEELDDE